MIKSHRRHRAASGRNIPGVPGAARPGLDGAAGAVLPQPAARPDRGSALRPRMAARLRQAAAAAVVAGRGRSTGCSDPTLLYYVLAQAARRRRLCAGLAHGAAAGRRRRRAGRGPDHRRPALFQLHGGQVQPRRGAAAVLGAAGFAFWAALRQGRTGIGPCSGSHSGCRFGRSISLSCWSLRSCCSGCSIAMRAARC